MIYSIMHAIPFLIKFSIILMILMIKEVYQRPVLRSYYQTSFRGYYIELIIGNPPQVCSMSVDISASFTRLSGGMYDKNSKTKVVHSESHSMVYHNQNMQGLEIEDIFRIGDNKYNVSSLLTFLHMNSSLHFLTPNAIGLGFSFLNDNYSFIHQLKAKDLIEQSAFSLVEVSHSEGSLYYGRIPQQETINKTVSFCNVKGRNGFWDCNMSKVLIKDKAYSNKDTVYVVFDSLNRNIEAPKEFEDFLVKEYLGSALTYDCKFQFKSLYEKEVICSPGILDSLPNITFVLENYSYSFGSELLFRCFTKECYLNVIINYHRSTWQFGLHFLRVFDLTFDYEESKLFFYSKSHLNIIKQYNIDEIKPILILYYIILWCIIDLLGGIVVLIINLLLFK